MDESTHHLFLECKIKQCVWSMCYRWIGILFVQLKDMICHFEKFHLVHVSSKHNLVWKGLWATIVWSIWEQEKLLF